MVVPSLEITRCKDHPIVETSKDKIFPESLYVVWRHPDAAKPRENENGRDSMYFFVA